MVEAKHHDEQPWTQLFGAIMLKTNEADLSAVLLALQKALVRTNPKDVSNLPANKQAPYIIQSLAKPASPCKQFSKG